MYYENPCLIEAHLLTTAITEIKISDMKTTLILLIIFLSNYSFAANEKALGFIFGNPTGLSGKYWLDDEKAIDAGVGFSFGKNNPLTLHSDYLFHKPESLYFNDDYPLDLFYGLGARMKFDEDINLGIRFPVGLIYKVDKQNAELFSELAPVLDLFSDFGLDLNLGFGARYYF